VAEGEFIEITQMNNQEKPYFFTEMAERGKERNFWRYYKKDNQIVKERLLNNGEYDKASMTGFGNFDELFSFFNEVDFFLFLISGRMAGDE